ncbi:hypothetical protein [Cohnella soli]|uniref:GIY-YIG domain-containing protein n=1 Tax=Cohnella soli TaxID=425005 RepID=A0ABW0HMP8_9BACL
MAMPYEPSERCIYVLQLESGFFFIGQTEVELLEERIKYHMNNKNAGSWTSMHRSIAIAEVVRAGCCTSNEARILENIFTLQYMSRYGWYKVRGGDYGMVDEILLYKALYKISIKGKLGFELIKPDHMSENYLNKIQKTIFRGPNKPKGFDGYEIEVQRKVKVSIRQWFSNKTEKFSLEQLESIDCNEICKEWMQVKAPWYGLSQSAYQDVFDQFEYQLAGRIRRFAR